MAQIWMSSSVPMYLCMYFVFKMYFLGKVKMLHLFSFLLERKITFEICEFLVVLFGDVLLAYRKKNLKMMSIRNSFLVMFHILIGLSYNMTVWVNMWKLILISPLMKGLMIYLVNLFHLAFKNWSMQILINLFLLI